MVLSVIVFSCFLWAAAAQLPTLSGAVAPSPALAPGPSSLENLPLLTATQAVQLLCSRQITATEYVTALYDRYESGDFGCLNPWIAYNLTQALASAQAVDDKYDSGQSILPLCGLPLAVKDAIDVEGFATTCATPAFQNLFPAANAPLVQMYLDANGIVLGKTNLGELQSGFATNPTNLTYGITTALNPYNPVISPSGSSSGSGVAVAARLTPLALCEDTGGSCMGPATANGIYSLRPTIGCYNFSDGLMPYQHTRDTVGSMARTAQDLILLDSVIRSSNYSTTGFGSVPDPVSCAVSIDPDFSLEGVRLGLPSTLAWTSPGISAELANVTEAALNTLRAAGAELVPFDSSLFDELSSSAWVGSAEGGLDGASSYEAPTTLARWLFLHNYTLNVPDVYKLISRPNLRQSSLETLEPIATGSNDDYARYISVGRPNITAYWNQVMKTNNFTALLYPQGNMDSPPLDRYDYGIFYNASGAYVEEEVYTTGFIPQIAGSSGAFPIGFSANGLPAGLLVAGPPGYDSTILNLLNQMEALFGELPAPPTPALCQGCDSNVTYLGTPPYNGTGQPAPGERWTTFGITFSDAPGGSCAADLLSYGQTGPTSTGPPENVTLSFTPVTGVTPTTPAAGSA